MSISLPGLARFGCDVSATVGGIPKFRPNIPGPDAGTREAGGARRHVPGYIAPWALAGRAARADSLINPAA